MTKNLSDRRDVYPVSPAASRVRCLLIVLCLFAGRIALGAEVRNPSDAERVAVAVVADYLVRGPQAVVDQLASTSPLRRLSADTARAEIEARLGPPAGAQWELQTVVPALKDKRAAFTVAFPSGVDDNVFFDLVNDGGTIRILNVRTLAEAAGAQPFFQTASPGAKDQNNPAPVSGRWIDAATLVLVVSLLVVLAGLFLQTRSPRGARISFLLGGAATFAVVCAGVWTSGLVVPEEIKPVIAGRKQGLATLVDLRRVVAAGGGDVAGALGAARPRGEAADVAMLWKAQNDLVQMRLEAVQKTLDGYSHPSNVPLVELLRARLALMQNDSARAVVAYQNAINIGPGRDGLWLEAAEAFYNGGYEDLGANMLHRAAGIGSRNAGIYYGQASEALMKDHLADAQAQFKLAWTMLPVQRRQLLNSGLLSIMVRQQGDALVSLSAPDEATFAAADVSTRAIDLPANAIARVSGEMFEMSVGDARLVVPGGAAMAPKNVAVVDAGAWARIGEDQALANVAQLIKDAATPAAFMQPVLRARITRAAQALYRRNRWSELADLTAGVSPKWQFIDAGVVLLRAEALRRLSHETEAKQVVLDLALSPVVTRRNNAATYEQIGEALASFDEFDAAIVMFSRAQKLQADHPFDLMRIEQMSMNRSLAKSYSVFESPHFHVHYPGNSAVVSALAVAQILEAELTRLQKWVPVPNFKPVVVNIVPWAEFRTIYAQGGDVLGFYDRAITIPLAGIQRLEPEITAIVTHELCHALIAQATHDQAPHWFHEGLAQRVEMVEYASNAFNMYDDNKLFALSVLDPIITQAQDGGMIEAAYIVSQTFIRYLEATYGDRAFKQLLAAFAAGSNTDEALQALTGTSSAVVDANFHKWGRAEKRVFQSPPPILYELSGQSLIQLTVPAEPPRVLKGGTLHGRRN